jgi:hypothetical protein
MHLVRYVVVATEPHLGIGCLGSMTHILRRPAWGVIDLDTRTGHIFVQEEWRYVWHSEVGAARWALAERRRFHHAVDAHIWGRWSNRIRVRATGTHEFARRNGDLPITFDVRWVLSPGHWTVHVTKLRPGAISPRSYVDFAARAIHLDTLDVVPHAVGNDAGQSRSRFFTIPHEFGHTLPDRAGSATPVDDEYNAGHAHLADTESLMNIGRQIRGRHVRAVVDELNGMLPGCQFAVVP